MPVPASVAFGFAVLRGLMLSVLTVPWLAGKLRRPGATGPERSLAWMAASRSVLLGVVLLALALGSRQEALGWALLGDGVLQVFDTLQAVALRQRRLGVLPGVLCLVDCVAGLALLR